MIHFSFKHPPICSYCGKAMKSWNPHADTHEHVECTSERVSDKLVEAISLLLVPAEKPKLRIK